MNNKLVKSRILKVLRTYYKENISADEAVQLIDTDEKARNDIMNVLRQHIKRNEITEEQVTRELTLGYINGGDMVKLIARNSSLSIDEVDEVFITFVHIVDTLIKSNNRSNISFAIPYFAKVEFKHKKGKKAGTVINCPSQIGEKSTKHIIEEDKPDYDVFKVKIKREYKERLREYSSNRYEKEKKRSNA